MKKFNAISNLESNFVIRMFRGFDNIGDAFFVVDTTFGIAYDIINIKNKSDGKVVHDGWNVIFALDEDGKFNWRNKIVTVGNFVGTVDDENSDILHPWTHMWQIYEMQSMPWDRWVEEYSENDLQNQLVTQNSAVSLVQHQLCYLRQIYKAEKKEELLMKQKKNMITRMSSLVDRERASVKNIPGNRTQSMMNIFTRLPGDIRSIIAEKVGKKTSPKKPNRKSRRGTSTKSGGSRYSKKNRNQKSKKK
jgi:hypothetical protein